MENLERKIKKKSIKVLDIYKEVVSLLNNQGLMTYPKSYGVGKTLLVENERITEYIERW